MKKQHYYLLLIASFVLGIYQIMQHAFTPQENAWQFILHIWSILVFFVLFWSKKELVGKGWFEKEQQKPPQTPANQSNQLQTPANQFDYKAWREELVASLPESPEAERNAYIALAKLCCSNDTQQKLIPFFEKLKDFSNDEDYMTTLNYVMEHCDEQEIFFLMALDWKQDIDTLEWRLENALQQNFDLSLALPDPAGYGERASVAYDNVFEDYDKPLRENGLQMGFIDTDSDEYVIFVHRCDDKEKVIKCVNGTGYRYQEKRC